MNTYTVRVSKALSLGDWDATSANAFCATLLQLLSMDGRSVSQQGYEAALKENTTDIVFATRQRLPVGMDASNGNPKMFGGPGTPNALLYSTSTDDRMGVASQPVMQPIGEAGDLCVVLANGEVRNTLNNVLTLSAFSAKADLQLCVGLLRESAQDGIYNNPFAGFLGSANARNFAARLTSPGPSSIATQSRGMNANRIVGPSRDTATLRDAAGNTIMRLPG